MHSGSDVVGAATMPPVGAIGQRLQRDQRAHHRFVPWAAMILFLPAQPVQNFSRRAANALRRRIAFGDVQMRRRVGQTKETVSPAATVKSPTVLRFSPRIRRRRVQDRHVGAGDGAHASRRRCASPTARSRRSRSAGSARCATRRGPRSPTTRRSRCGVVLARRHEVDQRRGAVVGLEAGFEDQRVGR